MLNPQIGKYALSTLPASHDRSGVYFPDAVVEVFAGLAKSAPPSPGLPAGGPVFTPEQARMLIQAALDEFDPSLGAKGRQIFAEGFDQALAASRADGFQVDWGMLEPGSSRWRLEQVPAGQCHMMRSIPAQSPASMYGPANPNDHAVIDYQFDGTINAVVYMAHEAGHSIGDDYLREGGHYSHPDLPVHMNETQAYFVQHVFYDYIGRHPELEQAYPGIGAAAQQHFSATMADNLHVLSACLAGGRDADMERLHERPLGIWSAFVLFRQAQEQTGAARARIAETVLGRHGPKPVAEVLAAAGIEYRADMQGAALRAAESLRADSAPTCRPANFKPARFVL